MFDNRFHNPRVGLLLHAQRNDTIRLRPKIAPVHPLVRRKHQPAYRQIAGADGVEEAAVFALAEPRHAVGFEFEPFGFGE